MSSSTSWNQRITATNLLLMPLKIAFTGRNQLEDKVYSVAARVLAGIAALIFFPFTLIGLASRWWDQKNVALVDSKGQTINYRSAIEKRMRKFGDEHSATPHVMILENRLDDLINYLSCEDLKSDPDFTAAGITEEIKYKVNDQLFYNLTPMHVAAMTCNHAAAKILLDTQVCNLSLRDSGGATPLFHATVNGDERLMKLLTRGTEQNCFDRITEFLTQEIANQECFDSVLSSQIFTQSYPTFKLENQSFNYDKDGIITTGNGNLFKKLTGSTLLEKDLIIHPKEWFEEWLKRSQQKFEPLSDSYNEKMKELYRNFRTNPPPLTYLKSDPCMGYYLCAGEAIPAFKIIGEYLGEVEQEKFDKKLKSISEKIDAANQFTKYEKSFLYPKDSSFDYSIGGCLECYSVETKNGGNKIKEKQVGVIDAFEYRGLMAMVGCSFPNVMTRTVIMEDGIRRVLFFSTEEIPKFSPFAFDYGNHSVKKMIYKEMRPRELEIFFTEYNTLEKLKPFLPKQNYSLDFYERLEQVAGEAKLDYLLRTPTAILFLCLRGILAIETIEELNYSDDEMINLFINELSKFFYRNKVTDKIRQELLDAIGHEETLAIYRRIKIINNE